MKKTFEYFYIFTKLSTSFILLSCLIILGYFLYSGYKNQPKFSNEQIKFFDELSQNTLQLSNLSKKIEITDNSLSKLKKILENSYTNKNSEEINNLDKQIKELNSKLEKISSSIKEIKISNIVDIGEETSLEESKNLILEKNKIELAELVILKFENNLDFSQELNVLQNLNSLDKQYIFEKLNLVSLKNFRGNIFLKKLFLKESEIFLKEKINVTSKNIITKSLMRFIEVNPSQKNIIKNEEINNINQIQNLIVKKKYGNCYKKILIIHNYEKYFSESVNQLQIAIEFQELIERIS